MNRRPAFSLIELLVVIAILGVLIALLLPAVQSVRATAARMSCQNNLRQMATACHSYEAARGALPPTIVPLGEPMWGLNLHVVLLPHLEQEAVYRRAEADCRDFPITHLIPPHAGMYTAIKTYQCPADDRQSTPHRTTLGNVVALTGYLGVAGVSTARSGGGVFTDGPAVRMVGITDGTSNTLMLGERPPTPDYICSWWYMSMADPVSLPTLPVRAMWKYMEPHPVGNAGYNACPQGYYSYRDGSLNEICDAFHFWSRHRGGANFAFCDGSVRFVRYEADSILAALATRAGGEAVALPD